MYITYLHTYIHTYIHTYFYSLFVSPTTLFLSPTASIMIHYTWPMSSGPLTCLPYNNLQGENPVEACGTSLNTNKMKGNYLSQSLPVSTKFLNICFSVPLKHSTRPSVSGRYGVVLISFTPSWEHSDFIRCKMKLAP